RRGRAAHSADAAASPRTLLRETAGTRNRRRVARARRRGTFLREAAGTADRRRAKTFLWKAAGTADRGRGRTFRGRRHIATARCSGETDAAEDDDLEHAIGRGASLRAGPSMCFPHARSPRKKRVWCQQAACRLNAYHWARILANAVPLCARQAR